MDRSYFVIIHFFSRKPSWRLHVPSGSELMSVIESAYAHGHVRCISVSYDI